MIRINELYYNKGRHIDIVRVSSVEYIDGVKVVEFTRVNKKNSYTLPIEMFEKNFSLVTNGYQ